MSQVLEKKIDCVFKHVEEIRVDQIYDSAQLEQIESTINYLVKRIRDLETLIKSGQGNKRRKKNAVNKSHILGSCGSYRKDSNQGV